MHRIALVPLAVSGGSLHIALADNGLPSLPLDLDHSLTDTAATLARSLAPGYADAPRAQVRTVGTGAGITIAYHMLLPGLVTLGPGYTWHELTRASDTWTLGPSPLDDRGATLLTLAVSTLADSIGYTTDALSLAGDMTFSVSDLREVYDVLWGVSLEPRNFQRKVLSVPGLLVATGRRQSNIPNRPGHLYIRGPASRISPPLLRPLSRQ